MADDGIKISISPSTITGGAGRRLTEVSPSFVNDKYGGGARFAAPGTGQRSEINVEKKLVDVQTQLVAEIKALRKAMRAAAPGTSERTSLQSRIDDLLAQQKRNLAGASNAGTIAREAKALTTRRGVAIMPSSRIGARSLIGAAQGIGGSMLAAAGAAWAGDPLAAGRHAPSTGASAYAAGRSLIAGGATEAAEGAAGGAAAEGAEAAGGIGIGSLLGVTGTAAALAVGGYEAYKHFDAVKALAESPLALFDARRYSRDEAVRQTQAYGYAREFGEAGGPLSSFTRSSKFSALGMDATQALDVTGGMREIAGSQNVGNAQAYRAARAGTFIGLSNQDISAIGGQAGKLGVDPERMIDIVAKGVERGGQLGLQGEVGRATLQYLQQQSRLGAVSETKAAETVTGMAALLGRSGIAAFRGEGAITAGVAGITAANQPGDLFGVQSVGSAYTLIGQSRLLQSINADPRYKRMSALDKAAMADRVLTQGLTGPNANLYLRSVVAPEIEQAKKQGLYGLESLEKAYNWPVGDQSDKLLTGSMLTAAQSGDVTQYLKAKSQLEASGAANIPAASVAMAGHAMARSAAGASAMKTFTGIENIESSMLRRLALSPSTDKNVASALDKLAGLIAPSDALPTSEAGAIPKGDTARIARADLSKLSLPPMLRAEMGGRTATSEDSARDSTLQAVGTEIVSAINVLVSAFMGAPGYSLPPPALSAPVAPAPASPASPAHGPVVPAGRTHR